MIELINGYLGDKVSKVCNWRDLYASQVAYLF